MDTLYQVLGVLSGGLIIWIMYHQIKSRPESFSRSNLSKSFFSMGVLAVLLIVFVAFLVFMTRST